MTTAIKRRRGTTAEHSTFVGLEGEITIDSTKDTVVVHDGSTAGGFPLAKENNATLTGNVTLSGGTANGVTYLNGSKVLTSVSGLTFDGTNLGIGTSSPAVKLHASGSSTYVAGIEGSSTGAFLGLRASGSSGSMADPTVAVGANADNLLFRAGGAERARITSSGNFGIGTTSPPSYGSTFTVVQASNSSSGILQAQNTTNSVITEIESEGTRGAVGTRTNHDLAFKTNQTERMRLTSTGLGIGTSSPLSALDVSNSFITVSKGATTTGRMGSSDYIVGGTDNDFVLQSSGTGVTRFVQTGSERMRIDSSGNLLVGTTSSNGRKLRVYGSGDLVELVSTNSGLGGAQIDLKHESASPADGDIVGLINFGGYDSGNNSTNYASIYGVASSVSSETGELRFGTRTNSSTYNSSAMVITSSGNVGIGTTSPTNGKLEVQTSATTAGLWVQTGGTTSSYTIADFRTGSNAPALAVKGDGKVGIYTDSPTARLEIGGTNNSLFFTNSGATTGYSYSAIQNTSGNLLFGVIGSNGVFWNNGGEAYAATIGTTQGKSLIFATNNNEAVRITPAGQLLAGATSINSWGSASPKIRAQGGIQISDYSLITEDVFDADSLCIVSDSTEHICFGNFTVATGTYNERMRIDSSGNVGIGTSSPGELLSLYKASGDPALRIQSSAGNCYVVNRAGTSAMDLLNSMNGPMTFATNNAERARIDSSGRLLVGTTTGIANGILAVKNASSEACSFQGGSNNYIVTLHNTSGTLIGSITGSSGSSTSYNTSSDYRLKEDWVAVADASTRVNALKPVNFAWKADGSRVDGFLAHELAEVVPEAVTGEKDAVDDEGKPVYQGIDQSKLVPLLTAALQEALAKIESLTARVSALEGN